MRRGLRNPRDGACLGVLTPGDVLAVPDSDPRSWWFTVPGRETGAGAARGDAASKAAPEDDQIASPARGNAASPGAGDRGRPARADGAPTLEGSLPSISLPKGGGAIRGIDEKLSREPGDRHRLAHRGGVHLAPRAGIRCRSWRSATTRAPATAPSAWAGAWGCRRSPARPRRACRATTTRSTATCSSFPAPRTSSRCSSKQTAPGRPSASTRTVGDQHVRGARVPAAGGGRIRADRTLAGRSYRRSPLAHDLQGQRHEPLRAGRNEPHRRPRRPRAGLQLAARPELR